MQLANTRTLMATELIDEVIDELKYKGVSGDEGGWSCARRREREDLSLTRLGVTHHNPMGLLFPLIFTFFLHTYKPRCLNSYHFLLCEPSGLATGTTSFYQFLVFCYGG